MTAILPRKEPLQARSRERFERILSAAIALITARGVDAVPMSDIARAAEISIASLYQYFPDKPAIVATLAARFNQQGQDCVKEAFAKVATKAEMRIAANVMTDSYFELFQQDPCALAVWQATQSDTRLQALARADDLEHADTVANALRRLMPDLTQAEASRLGSILAGMVAAIVRVSVGMPAQDANAVIEDFKTHVLSPSLNSILA